MLSKLVIGTANFTSPYGVMADDTSVNEREIKKILELADMNQIDTFDTALGYGDLFALGTKLNYDFSSKKIITKFSLLEDFDALLNKLKNSAYKYHAMLVHDPDNLYKIDKNKFLYFVDQVKSLGISNKIGLSVYELSDVNNFKNFFTPQIIQMPLNPLNQKFLSEEFTYYTQRNNIEVHARSLFLQGILLAEKLPNKLYGLNNLWQEFVNKCSNYHSHLEVLLDWAFGKDYIAKWVFGVSCVQDFKEILSLSKNIKITKNNNIFEDFKEIINPLTDPRNWSSL